MDIKTILKDTNFIDFMDSVSNMKLDIFETVEENKAFGITRSKFRICYDKVISNKHIYDNCYAAYKQAMTHLNTLYATYTSEFATIDEFAEELFDKLKIHVGSANVLLSNNIKPKRTLNPAEIADYEAKRIHYIEVILTQVIPTLNNLTAVKALENANVETLANFVDETEAKLDSIITEFGGDITDQQTRTAVLHEYLVTYLPESYINGDNLTTQKIEINKTRFDGHDPKYSTTPKQLKTLAFLENFILANNFGLTANNIAFDGFRFFDTTTGKSISVDTRNLHGSRLYCAERYLQSNFVLDEDFAKALLTLPKRYKKIRGQNSVKNTTVVDGDTITTIKLLYRPATVSKSFNYDWCLNLGNFCKVKEINHTKGTYTYMLYYFPDQDGKKPIQLFRIDKVEDMFKGAPASHNLRGKEKIETTLHAHTYNLIDATLKNYTKEDQLGKMDLSHIFPVADGLDSRIIEEYFDHFCGIHGQHLRRVNQAKFAQFFGKYNPVDYSFTQPSK